MSKNHPSKKRRTPQGGSPLLAALVALAAFVTGYLLGLSGAELAAMLAAMTPFLVALARRK